MFTPAYPANTKIIAEAIEKLRSCSQVDILSTWRCLEAEIDIRNITEAEISNWDIVKLNEKGHIPWTGGEKVLWLAQKLVVPSALSGYPLAGLSLRLALAWSANSASIHVNGKLVAEGDLFDYCPRVLISESVKSGDEFIVALRLVSLGHCDGALVQSLLVYEARNGGIDPGFVADELAVMSRYFPDFVPEVDWEKFNRKDAKDAKEEKREKERFLVGLRQGLIESQFVNPKSKIYLLGHAHLDMAWLWRVCETWKAAQNTFESVLKLQEDFPELIFCHSTPALYAWVEENLPDLFARIQEKVKDGRWEVVGGFWVEPELNIIAGESIVRQLLYGQRYVWEKFGKLATVVWVPDSFGFTWTLPQFMQQAGIEFFVTQKLRWNDTTKFPFGAFWWRSPDGSQVFSWMSGPVGEGINPVKIADYAVEWERQTGLQDYLCLPGVGDHGGGPTRDMLEIARRWQSSPLFPELEFTTAQKYLHSCRDAINGISVDNKPIWDDELYLEFHRGCYTTHGDQKWWNRRCENLLYEAELFAALANLSFQQSYPQIELEKAWKQVLFHQFHDILPGSSITEVYEDAEPEWQEVEKIGSQILQQSLQGLAAQIQLPEPPSPHSLPIVVFNSLNWVRSQVVAVDLPQTPSNQPWHIYNHLGEKLISQFGIGEQVLFLADDIPSVGYRLFWLVSGDEGLPNANNIQIDSTLDKYTKSEKICQTHFESKKLTFENEFLRVIIESETGNLASIFDKVNNREVLDSAGGNQLQFFQDSGQDWDAWNIDPNYAQHPLPAPQLKSIECLETGSVQTRIRVIKQWGASEFRSDYILQTASPILKIANTVDWRESHVLVKAAFPLQIEADFATYEIPCGTIRRSTKPQTPEEKAKWEVPALRWADITQDASPSPNTYGVSLLNDCKYGYDTQPNQLRLSLLRSPKWPDSQADQGIHQFTYALYPHPGNWKQAHTVRQGYELNLPLQVVIPDNSHHNPSLPPIGSLLDLGAENLILMAFKQAEDHPQQWILRCYESHGETAEFRINSDLGLKLGESVDLLERPTSDSEFSPTEQNLTIQPWKIANFRVSN
ncbi:MAG: alpha-mannosidase [Nostocaceae cyanobacterium]|nr:alpha-mannosidase [Nostocaceae cyanobacterium]